MQWTVGPFRFADEQLQFDYSAQVTCHQSSLSWESDQNNPAVYAEAPDTVRVLASTVTGPLGQNSDALPCDQPMIGTYQFDLGYREGIVISHVDFGEISNLEDESQTRLTAGVVVNVSEQSLP